MNAVPRKARTTTTTRIADESASAEEGSVFSNAGCTPRRRVIRKATRASGDIPPPVSPATTHDDVIVPTPTLTLTSASSNPLSSDVVLCDLPIPEETAVASATSASAPRAPLLVDETILMTKPEPSLLARRNAHPRDEFIVFDPIPHTYTIHGEGGYTSVTTWIHSHFSDFNADAIITKMMRSPKWPENKYYGMTREEIKAAWDANRDEAASAGTAMHYDIECFYNEMPTENDSIEYRYFKEFETARTAPGGFGEHLRPYRTEWMVYYEEAKLAGSIDMVYEDVRDGTLQIYDWKRSKEIKKSSGFQSSTTECISHLPDTNYWHYSLQLNTYRQILQRKYGKRVVALYLVVLHPDNKSKTFERIKVPFLETEMADLFAERVSRVASGSVAPHH